MSGLDHRRSLKRPFSRSRSRSRSGSESFSGSDGKVSVEIFIADDLVGHLMGQNLKHLENMRKACSPVTIWIKARCSSNRQKLRSMLLRGDSQVQLDEARVQIHQFFQEKLKITVDGVLQSPPRPRSSTSQSHLNSQSNSNVVDGKNPLVLPLPFPLPTPTPTVSSSVSHSETQKSPGASSHLHENLTSERTIPIFREVDEEFQEMVECVRDIIHLKFPETEVSLLTDEKTDGASNMIFIRAPSPLSVEVARLVILKEFKNQLGVSLEEENPGLKELKEKLKKSEELVRNHENEIRNLRSFHAELEQNRTYYKEKYNKKIKTDSINEKEFIKMKMKLKSSQSDYELVVNEKVKLSKKVVDLENQLEEHSEFIRIFKSCDKNDNDSNPEDDQNKEICLKCPHLLFEIKNLKESLSVAEGLVSLREQELDLLKKRLPSYQEENNVDISG